MLISQSNDSVFISLKRSSSKSYGTRGLKVCTEIQSVVSIVMNMKSCASAHAHTPRKAKTLKPCSLKSYRWIWLQVRMLLEIRVRTMPRYFASQNFECSQQDRHDQKIMFSMWGVYEIRKTRAVRISVFQTFSTNIS